MKRIVLTLLLLCSGLSAQSRLDFFWAVRGDSVFIWLNQTPRIGQAFHVERRASGRDTFERLTDIPVAPVLDPAEARRILGGDFSVLASALKLDSPEKLLFRLRSDDYYGQVATLISRRAATVLGRFFVRGGHSASDSWTYRVLLTDRSGEILASAEHVIKIQPSRPQPVQNLAARQEGASAVIEWNYPRWNGDMADVTFQFMLFRSAPGAAAVRVNGPPLLRLEGFPLRFTDTTIHPGRTYTYRIVALDAAGRLSEAAGITLVTRDLLAPAYPENLTAQVAGDAVILRWDRNREPDLAGYNVYRWIADQSDPFRLNSQPVPPSVTTYGDTTAQVAVSYYYGVAALDTAGNESPFSGRIHALVTDRTPPGKPADLTARVETGRVALTWTPPPDRDVAGYQVSRGRTGATAFLLHDKLVEAASFTDTRADLKRGGPFHYSVTAVDTMGYPGESATVTCLLPDGTPPEPPGRVAVRNHLGREIRIQWNPSLSGDVHRYRIRRVMEDDTITLGEVSGDTLALTDTDLQKGDRAVYAVSAVDSAGNRSAESRSDPVILKDYNPPTATAYVTAELTDHGVRVRWEPAGDFDLAGYNIYRGELPTGLGEKLNGDPVQETLWLDTAGKSGSWYWIRTVDTSGNESQESKAVQCIKMGQ